MSEEFLDERVRTHVVSFCRERCSEYSFKTSEEFRECVNSCIKEILNKRKPETSKGRSSSSSTSRNFM